ncbi:MAG: DnaD domain protein [Firmicutes bacterium]|nr:DnaD domain protein [Bacillota bacterium]
MNYGINLGQWNSIFAVPTDVVDKHMKLAGAAQLKVLLYLLRHAGSEVTLDTLAFAVGQKPSDTQDAVEYWINCGLLSCGTESKLSPISENCEAPQENPAQSAPTSDLLNSTPTAEIKNALGQSSEVKGKEKIRYRFDECMKFVAEDEQLKNMLTAVEATLGKQLTHTEVTCFVTLAKWYGLPCTIIPMLVQYCKSIGKSSISYIEATGIGWAAEEIDNFEKAEQKISALTARRRAWNSVRSALEIPERKATETELKFSDLWINSQHIDTELIRHAYDKCVNKTGKVSFSYMNGIIKRYFERGITDITSALKLDEQNRAEIEAKQAARKAAAADSITELAGGNTQNGRYASTYDTGDIEAILDAEWMSEEVGSDSDYDYND